MHAVVLPVHHAPKINTVPTEYARTPANRRFLIAMVHVSTIHPIIRIVVRVMQFVPPQVSSTQPKSIVLQVNARSLYAATDIINSAIPVKRMISIIVARTANLANRLLTAGNRVNVQMDRASSGSARMAITSRKMPVSKIPQKHAARMKPTVWIQTASMTLNATKANAKRRTAQPDSICTIRHVSLTPIAIAAIMVQDAQQTRHALARSVFASQIIQIATTSASINHQI